MPDTTLYTSSYGAIAVTSNYAPTTLHKTQASVVATHLNKTIQNVPVQNRIPSNEHMNSSPQNRGSIVPVSSILATASTSEIGQQNTPYIISDSDDNVDVAKTQGASANNGALIPLPTQLTATPLIMTDQYRLIQKHRHEITLLLKDKGLDITENYSEMLEYLQKINIKRSCLMSCDSLDLLLKKLYFFVSKAIQTNYYIMVDVSLNIYKASKARLYKNQLVVFLHTDYTKIEEWIKNKNANIIMSRRIFPSDITLAEEEKKINESFKNNIPDDFKKLKPDYIVKLKQVCQQKHIKICPPL